MSLNKKAVFTTVAATATGLLMLWAGTALADKGAGEIRVERHDSAFYTRLAPADRDSKIDPRLLGEAYKSKLFCIPDAGERKSVYHGYLWVVILLHAGGGAALAFVLVGDRIKSFFGSVFHLQ